jgi:SAM-dependent methyltransferase
LLDVGCDTGGFLQAAAQEFGIVPVGVDAASRAVAAARQQGIETYLTLIENAPDHLRDFRIITVIDLIEHVTDPTGFLREIRTRLRPGGLVYLETPNIHSAVYRIGHSLGRLIGWRPAGILERLFPPQHAQYFTLASLAGLARTVGFEVVRIDTRVLPWSDIAASLPVRAATSSMQLLDRCTGARILIWAVLRRPASGD